VNCGVESTVYDVRSNLCPGCGGMLFRRQLPAPKGSTKILDIALRTVVYGGYGLAAFLGGGWVLIVTLLVVLAAPFYILFAVSLPLGLAVSLLLTAWLVHRSWRPEAVARRREKRLRRKIQAELKLITDDLPLG
jgi:hypothetical protein